MTDRPGLILPVLTLLLTATLLAAGCSRQLNERYDFEKKHAAAHFLEQGRYDLDNGRIVEALGNLTEAVRIWPAQYEARWHLGRIWQATGHAGKAEREFALARSYAQNLLEMEADAIDAMPPGPERERRIRVRAMFSAAPEPLVLEDPEVTRALIEGRPVPADADWVVDDTNR